MEVRRAMPKKTQWVRKIFALVLAIAVAGALQFYPKHSEARMADFDTFSEAYFQLMKFFIHPLKPQTLIHGAIKGMNVELAHKRIDYTVPSVELTNSAYDDLETFHQTFDEAANTLTGKIKLKDLMGSALEGMFESTGDPYTTYLSSEDYHKLKEQMNGGNFGGIGIYIELEKGTKRLMVLEPIEGTPASHAGLKAGDYILRIDGKPTKGMDLDVAQKLIRGPIGSEVVLSVEHKNSEDIQDVPVKRAMIRVKSVTTDLKDGDIGYVRLRSFGEFTGGEIEKALTDLESRGARAYILDLRNNGGGYIEAAKEVCSKFLPRRAVVVSVLERDGHVDKDLADGSEHPDYPMVVLVNEFSASASEITAGALQDYKRAKIVGVRTFGKGSVQTIIPLANRGAAKITIAHYLTPSGKDINKRGINPDVAVSMKGHPFSDEEDEQLQKAISVLKQSLANKSL